MSMAKHQLWQVTPQLMGTRYQPWLEISRLLIARIESSKTEDGGLQRHQAFRNDGFDNRKIGVVIVVDENVAHSSNLIPLDGWFTLDRGGIKMLDHFTDLHQSHTTGVIDQTLLKSTDREILIDGVNGGEDVDEPLLIVTSYKEEASANTSSRTKWRSPCGVQTSTLTPSSSSNAQPRARMSSG